MANNNCQPDKLIKVFYVIYALHVARKISENNFIYILNKLTNVGFKLTSVPDIENIIFYLNTGGFNYSYMTTMLVYLKHDIFNSIFNVLNNYKYLRDCVYEEDITNHTDIIIRSKKVMCEKYTIIKSFCKLCPPPKEASLIKYGKGLTAKNNIIGSFNLQFNHDLINRLFQLRSNFDLDILKYMGIKLMTYNNIKEMNVVDLTKYYISCVNAIKDKLSKWINLCDVYIDTEIMYLKTIKKITNVESFTLLFNTDTCDILITPAANTDKQITPAANTDIDPSKKVDN